MIKNIYIIFFLVFTFLLGPTQTYATTMQGVMECCMEMSTEMSCCNIENDTNQEKMACKGNCESIGCTSPVTCCYIILLSQDNMLTFVSSRQRQQHFYAEVLISSDFRSIWLPPKIA